MLEHTPESSVWQTLKTDRQLIPKSLWLEESPPRGKAEAAMASSGGSIQSVTENTKPEQRELGPHCSRALKPQRPGQEDARGWVV